MMPIRALRMRNPSSGSSSGSQRQAISQVPVFINTTSAADKQYIVAGLTPQFLNEQS